MADCSNRKELIGKMAEALASSDMLNHADYEPEEMRAELEELIDGMLDGYVIIRGFAL